MTVPGEARSDRAQILLRVRPAEPVGDKHSGIVSLRESCFPYVGGIPDSRILHPDFIDFCLLLLLIETTPVTIRNNARLASKLPKALGQNLTSRGTGPDPTATTVFSCQPERGLHGTNFSVGFWGVEREQMWRTEPLSEFIGIRCPALRAALQTELPCKRRRFGKLQEP